MLSRKFSGQAVPFNDELSTYPFYGNQYTVRQSQIGQNTIPFIFKKTPSMKLMKSILTPALIVLTVLASDAVTGQVCGKKLSKDDVHDIKELVGTWSGEIKSGNGVYPLSISIQPQGEELLVKIEDASLPIKKLKAAVSICSTDKYHFYGLLPSGERFSYSPRLKNGMLTGSYQIGEVCSLNKPTFNLKRRM